MGIKKKAKTAVKRILFGTRDRLNSAREAQQLADIAKELGRPLVLLDVGARFGLHPAWKKAVEAKIVKAYALEPDAEECERLNSHQDGVIYLPVAVGDKAGKSTFHITRHPGAASVLEPDLNVLNSYPVKEYFELERTTEVELTTIDTLVEVGLLPTPDIIKIDVQGFEYEVLRGAQATLKKVLGIELETQLKPIYKNQKLFGEIYAFLDSHGFMLCHLDPQGPFEGEVVEMEAYFFKKEDSWFNSLVRHFWLKTIGVRVGESLARIVVTKDAGWFLSNKYVSQHHIERIKKLSKLDLLKI